MLKYDYILRKPRFFDRGPQGIQGIQGPAGRDGLNGEQGIQGIQGVKGDPGSLILAYQNTDSNTAAGNTNEQNLFTYNLPGGTMGLNDVIKITALFKLPGNTNGKILKVYFGNFVTFSTSVVTASNISYALVDFVINRNSLTSQISTPLNLSFVGPSTSANAIGTENTANNVQIRITGKPDNSSDVITLESCFVELIKP